MSDESPTENSEADTTATGDGAALEAVLADSDVDPEAVARLLERTDDVHAVLDLVAVATAALDDESIRTLSETGATLGGLANRATDDGAVRVLDSGLVALGEAGASDPEPAGLLDTLRALRDPDVRKGLGTLLAMAKAFGRELRERQD
ncbi:DUF1641 domain-containing protein [Halococcoides cellulosivorans]|uniref:DUF1641 domain-containing protein n=1 Tax=Halococcoides cellulosivorans TaxID=1679096 RepID=A0A2R4WY60_9EURY|nr:DUF1641 domain-containing protein [Halococcoides cellulosivorans]AWB26466.1 hypothetical protein HARCEL1_01405 [Halococcoides cellulosivorans]